MSKPPAQIDNAKVLCWAWSGEKPFGALPEISDDLDKKIYGLAICQYEDSSIVYRFSCDQNWRTVQDHDYSSAEDAMRFLPHQYKNVPVNWVKFER